MKFAQINRLLFVLILGYSFISSAQATNPLPYDSLKDFCIATNADTAANCTCGQETADKIMSKEEQYLVLGMMLKDPAAMQHLQTMGAQMIVLMQKVEQVTAGCQ